MSSTADRIAKIISLIFIPPLMILYSFIYLVFWNSNFEAAYLYIPILFGVVLPIATFIILRKKGLVSDNEALQKEERAFPYMIGVLLLAIGLLLFLYFGINGLPLNFWISYLVNSFIIIPITKFWKISAHSMGTSIPAALFFVGGGPFFVISIVITALVWWARYRLKCHDIYQLSTGYALGFITSFFIIGG